MKATLHFNLDDSDDALEHFRCIKSIDMAHFIYDLAGKLRELTDTSEDGKYIDEAHIWEKWEELCQNYDINLHKLIL